MYSREEAAQLRQQFWIAFGKYMKPIPSAEGMPINWVNYKTGVKHVFFRMNAEQRLAAIAIELTHPDETIRLLFFEQLLSFKAMFTDALQEQWDWQANAQNAYGAPLSQIVCSLGGVSVYNQADWPVLISFLKARIIALDEFWSGVKPIFEAL